MKKNNIRSYKVWPLIRDVFENRQGKAQKYRGYNILGRVVKGCSINAGAKKTGGGTMSVF